MYLLECRGTPRSASWAIALGCCCDCNSAVGTIATNDGILVRLFKQGSAVWQSIDCCQFLGIVLEVCCLSDFPTKKMELK